MSFHSYNQHTVNKPISFVGIGLHSGTKSSISIKPCSDGKGIRFVRKEIGEERGTVAARWFNVVDSSLSTVIGNHFGVTVSTVEHLLAALTVCGVDNAVIDVDGPEVPIMDGSATNFIESIENIGLRSINRPRNVIWIKRPIEVRDGDKYALLLPDNMPKYTVSIDFPETIIGSQTFTTVLDKDIFKAEISDARTFGFKEQIDQLKAQGLVQGGSLKNAVLVDGQKIINKEGLRHEDEFVRHKLLDAVGDMALSGVPVVGHYYGYKPGHAINRMLLQKLFEDQSAWDFMQLEDLHNLYGMAPEYGAMSTIEQHQIDMVKTGGGH